MERLSEYLEEKNSIWKVGGYRKEKIIVKETKKEATCFQDFFQTREMVL